MNRENLYRIVSIILFSLIALHGSLSASEQSFESYKYKYPSQEKIDKQVDSVFRKLSTREKIAQIMVINFTSRESKEKFEIQKRLVKKEKIGGLIPLGDVFVPAIKKMNELNKLAKIPLLMTLDAEWGASMRWGGIPVHQRFIQMGALTSDSLIYLVGKSIAMECRALKIQVNYSPVVDINNNPQRVIVSSRSFGEDKDKVARFAITMMHGLHDGGVAGSAKHFPGHGDTDVDSHLALPLLPFSSQRMDSLELYPFKQLIAAGIDMVMVGHLSVPSLDPSGVPASISKPIVTGLLKEKLGFNGIVCTDALDMNGVSKESGLAKKDIPLAAYKAGVDLLLMPEDVEESITVIEKALENGEITMEGLDMRVKKMLALKARLGVFDKGHDPFVNIEELDLFTNPESGTPLMETKLNLVKEVSKQSMTVVFNDNSAGYGIPVSLERKKVAYVGFRNPKFGHEFGVLANRYGQIDTVILGSNASLAELKDAKERLSNHDLIIFGYNETDLRPYKDFLIVPEEINFITDWAAEKPMIFVYLGSPYAITRIPGHKNFNSYVVGYLSTQENNFAAAQVVFGGVPAKGVLPVTSAGFKEGESVIIPTRYREEYFHYIGSKADSISTIVQDMNQKSALFTVVPQVAELVVSGKVKLTETVGELLDTNSKDKSVTVEELLQGWKEGTRLHYLQALLDKYRKHTTIEEAAINMFNEIGMKSTKFSNSKDTVQGYTVPNVLSNEIDYNKYMFTIKNGGKYAGKQILSPAASNLIQKIQ